MIHVYGWDPGATTGWCHLSIKDDESSLFRTGQVDHFELGDMLRNREVFSHPASSSDIEAVFICESFQPTPGKVAPWSLESIGLIRYWAHFYHIPLEMYAPSEHKLLVGNKVLKNTEFWTPGQQHARDATSLAIYWLIKERRLLTWLLRKETMEKKL